MLTKYQEAKEATTSELTRRVKEALGAGPETYEARLAFHELRSRLLEAQAALRGVGYKMRKRG